MIVRQCDDKEPPEGDIEFKIDLFKYPNSEEVALKDISFYIKKGNTLGIVGKTGAGKTSILKLLLRDNDHYDGEIKFGNKDIRNYTLDALLQSIGYVPQDTFLFSTSIRDNIRFSDPNLSQEKVENATKISYIHEDIITMPN